jgi:leader peptidase (prepilin peptidase) / N-methyltransferase
VLVGALSVLGLFVGSYVGLVADRLPRGEPTATGRSRCDACGHELSWTELIPVLSWVVQRARCRHCGSPITLAAPGVEMLTALTFGAMAWRFGAQWELVAYCVLMAGLVTLSIIDLRTHRLPRQIIYVCAAMAAPFLAAGALVHDEPRRLLWASIGAAGAVAFFALLYFGWRGAMGDGDVRLAGLLGLHLGWIGPLHVPVGLFLGFVAGAVVGVVAMARGAGRKTMLPFGPFMALGATVTILWGRDLIDAWLGA